MEDARETAHKDQVTVTARFVRITERWLDGKRTSRRCTIADEVTSVARFALSADHPWPDERLPDVVEVDLPCPELSRPAYAQLYHYDPDDTQRDGLGRAPVLRAGKLYRLTMVRDLRAPLREPNHPTKTDLVPTLVAVNPR